MEKRILILCLFSVVGFSQSSDRNYYNFWPGTWASEINGVIDTSKTKFVVTKDIHPFSYSETWTMPFDSAVLHAKGLRVWDDSLSVWSYIWWSDRGHYQIWESRKIDGNWYIYRRFNIKGDKYLSRQAWIPLSNNRLTRVSEKSYDEGKTWQLRFRETYVKIKD